MKVPPARNKNEPVVSLEAAQAAIQGRRDIEAFHNADEAKEKSVESGMELRKKVSEKQVSVKLSADLLQRCDRAALAFSVTRSAYIKLALKKQLNRDNF